MESSSNESFAWTKASSYSDDADSVKSTSMFENKEIYNDDVNINTSNNDSEKKQKKRKLTKTPDVESSIDSPKRKKIKKEPAEDSRKKHRKNENESNETLESLQESILHDDYYLNLKVKQEQESLNVSTNLKSKKKKKKKHHIDNHSGNDSFDEISIIKMESSSEKEEKKPKKKKYKDLESHSFVPYETLPLTSPKKKKSKRNGNMKAVKSNNSKLIFEDETFSNTQTDVERNDEEITDTVLNDVSTESINIEQKTIANETLPLTSAKKKKSKRNGNMKVVESNNSKLNYEDETFSSTHMDVERNDKEITKTVLNDVSTESINIEQKTIANQKKKKSKSNKDVSSENNLVIEDKFSAEEAVVQKQIKYPLQIANTKSNSEINVKEDDANCLLKEKIDTVKKNLINAENIINTSYNNNSYCSETNEDNFKSENKQVLNNSLAKESHNKSMNRTKTKKDLQGAPKLMDRLRFEEDDSEVDNSQSNAHSSCFNKLLKVNTDLQPVLQSSENITEITQNDEIWLVKCSQEVDILSCNNKDLEVGNKSKIKINGQTYIGTLDEGIDNLTIVSTDKSEFVIKKNKINGIITFNKRLPRPHVAEDNVMINNQTDFIPLPETKCRHPLFGSNYKNAIKIPKLLSQRLNSFRTDTSTPSYSERKKKKKYNKDKEMDVTLTVKEPKAEVAEDVPRKKAKKRKHNNDDEISVKKPKRVKQELDSSEVWESEKAIEENLFSF